jgi:hypothetical protein
VLRSGEQLMRGREKALINQYIVIEETDQIAGRM